MMAWGLREPVREMDWTRGGACIGIPIAMTRGGVPQAHLLPGVYLAKLELVDELGVQAEARFRISAPGAGGKIEVALIE
ncbi:MAG: hypothetical protein QGH66_05050 [Dehalococcoidia bacterium]|jgi:hypothetical protein|nr:hypothetical protein [Dehalococcoidia bacterium]MDP7239777.1 hypothetical protein [Dehalococcoidia bacterium]